MIAPPAAPSRAVTVGLMPSLATSSLSPSERRVLEQFVRLLQTELGGDLRAVWLYGSRARGEQPSPDSDVDLLVVSTRRGSQDDLRVVELLMDAAEAEGANPAFFSAKLFDPDRIAERRNIRSFFMQEVDRDKVVLFGEP
jgi:predicted nucleotidyltransferase